MSIAGIVVTSIFGSILLILILSLFTAWIILRRSNSHKYLSKMVEEWKKNPDPAPGKPKAASGTEFLRPLHIIRKMVFRMRRGRKFRASA